MFGAKKHYAGISSDLKERYRKNRKLLKKISAKAVAKKNAKRKQAKNMRKINRRKGIHS